MPAEILGAAALAATLPGSLYLAALTAAATRNPPSGTAPGGDGLAAARVVIVVPAHDESLAMLRTLRSLQREQARDPHPTRIVVVADNCSDDTALVALAAGVDVLERHDPVRRGKGYALRHAFETITDADWFIVIDADTDVEPGFLAAMRAAMTPQADALQCRYGVRDPRASRATLLADVALGAWNVLRPRGRAVMGTSVGILGNGFALPRRTLDAVPYTADSIVEDVEYHHLLVSSGRRVRWVDGAQVRGDIPGQRADQGRQRARWEGGRLRLLRERAPALLGALLRGQRAMLDPLLDLALLPLAWHVALLLAALALGGATVGAIALGSLAVVAAHVFVALVLIDARRSHLRALLGAPAYLLWKLSLAAATWRASGRETAWQRSARAVR